VRPAFVETEAVADTMYLNHVVDGNVYMVHTAAKSSIDMFETLQERFPAITRSKPARST
jgi:dihydroorotase-like cyclic amidohydrolase